MVSLEKEFNILSLHNHSFVGHTNYNIPSAMKVFVELNSLRKMFSKLLNVAVKFDHFVIYVQN